MRYYQFIGLFLVLLTSFAAKPKQDWEYRYRLRNTGPIIAGTYQTYTVDITARNLTKTRHIDRINFHVRIYQAASPNDAHIDCYIGDLEPKEVRTISPSVQFFNFQYIGRTGPPKVEVTASE